MKLLKDILYKVRIEQVVGSTHTAIEQVTADSRMVTALSAFVAIKGLRTDGHAFIDKAVAQGASVIICETLPEEQRDGVTYVTVPDSAEALGTMAANFHDHPSRGLKLVGITGTNGKTSVATLLYNLYRGLGKKVALVGTVETRIGARVIESTHTTPDAVRINELLTDMVEQRCSHCFMEVSSHAVVQHRIAGLHFAAGVFTNITRDHLDYHGTFDAYIGAKKRFFDLLPGDAVALVNTDDAHAEVMLQNTRARKRSFAARGMADHRARIIANEITGLHLDIDGHDLYSRLIGEFNASNLLAAYSVAISLGEAPMDVLTVLSDLEPPPGRFQLVRGSTGTVGVVDYAHTPDALKNVLATIGKVCPPEAKVITVVGCGGDRDKGKRPMMARIAAEMSDRVVITSDNPRSEDPMAIIGDMREGIPAAALPQVFVNADRREAIRQAVGMAGAGDVVLVAGKGHETYQEVAGVREPFDDAAVLRETLELLHK